MAKMLAQLFDRVGVFYGCVGVHHCGGAAVDALLHDHADLTDGQGFAQQLEFRPGRGTLYIYVGAEPQLVARLTYGLLKCREGAMADQADDLCFVVAKTMFGEVVEVWPLAIRAIAGLGA